MQKLTYINLRNEQVVFFHEPFLLAKIGGLGAPDLDVEKLRGAYQQGQTLAGFRRDAREVEATFSLWGQSRADLYAQRQRLLGVLSPDRAVSGDERARILYENDAGRWWTWAVPEGGIVESTSKRFRDILPEQKVRFLCESPYWFAMTQDSMSFTYSGEGLRFPLGFPLTLGRRGFTQRVRNTGQSPVPVEVWIEGRGETPALLNRTTGARVALTSALANGHTLYVNTDPARLRATVTDADGVTTNAFGLLSVSDPLTDFVLTPGTNELKYVPGGASTRSEIELKWYARFEGV